MFFIFVLCNQDGALTPSQAIPRQPSLPVPPLSLSLSLSHPLFRIILTLSRLDQYRIRSLWCPTLGCGRGRQIAPASAKLVQCSPLSLRSPPPPGRPPPQMPPPKKGGSLECRLIETLGTCAGISVRGQTSRTKILTQRYFSVELAYLRCRKSHITATQGKQNLRLGNAIPILGMRLKQQLCVW